MSAAQPRRRIGTWVAIVAVVVVVALLVGRTRRSDNAFDPASAGPGGAKALVDLLGSFGARVDVVAGAPTGADVAIMLHDDLPDAEAAAPLDRWLRAGGVLVVADPASRLVPPAQSDDRTGRLAHDQCDIPALAGAGDLDVSMRSRFTVPAGAGRCYASGAGAFVVSQRVGAGTLVSIGSPQGFVNRELGRGDNSVLAADLLAPRPGTRVAFIAGPAPGAGDRTLSELLGGNVKLALLQLALGFVVYALWRARRLGRPVPEAAPVQIDGSELTLAVGRLLARARDPAAAATRLRAQARRVLAPTVGLPGDAGAAAVATAVAARSALDRARVQHALADGPIRDENALVELAAELDHIRKEVSR